MQRFTREQNLVVTRLSRKFDVELTNSPIKIFTSLGLFGLPSRIFCFVWNVGCSRWFSDRKLGSGESGFDSIDAFFRANRLRLQEFSLRFPGLFQFVSNFLNNVWMVWVLTSMPNFLFSIHLISTSEPILTIHSTATIPFFLCAISSNYRSDGAALSNHY